MTCNLFFSASRKISFPFVFPRGVLRKFRWTLDRKTINFIKIEKATEGTKEWSRMECEYQWNGIHKSMLVLVCGSEHPNSGLRRNPKWTKSRIPQLSVSKKRAQSWPIPSICWVYFHQFTQQLKLSAHPTECFSIMSNPTINLICALILRTTRFISFGHALSWLVRSAPCCGHRRLLNRPWLYVFQTQHDPTGWGTLKVECGLFCYWITTNLNLFSSKRRS